jgi:glucose/arabinose dehydrogenase
MKKGEFLYLGTIVISISLILFSTNKEPGDIYPAYATASSFDEDQDEGVILHPTLKNNLDLKVEEVLDGLDFPTSMAFLGPDDILVLEKNEGKVMRVLNGILLGEPLLDVNVANEGEQGLLGIAIAERNSEGYTNIKEDNTTYVFLYYTESEDDNDGGEAVGNRLYRYKLEDNQLVNPKLLLDLPAGPGRTHHGGKLVIGPDDDNLYITIGDIGSHDLENAHTIINNKEGLEPDGRAGVLRVNQEGKAIQVEGAEGERGGILGNEYPLNLYYAYGIRNSFGIDFDPVTGKLWDVETGSDFGEEINLVEPGFNSGWMKTQGIWELDENQRIQEIASLDDTNFLSELVDFDGKGKYSSPEFTWPESPITTSGMAFFHSNKLGKQYENDLFVGDFVNGIIFNFNLNEDRTQLYLNIGGPLEDKVADNVEELDDIVFGYGFGGITDIKIGPYDGFLYVLSLDQGGDECKPEYPDRSCIPYSSTMEGHIYRISTASAT